MEIFFAISAFVIIMAMSTSKPVQNGLLGETLVCLITSYVMFQKGGWDILWGILAVMVAILCLILVGIISLPMSWTTYGTYNEQGQRVTATRFVMGEGAKTDTLKLPAPTYVIQVPQLANRIESISLDKETNG